MQKLQTQRKFRSLVLAALVPAALAMISACDDDDVGAQPPQLAQATAWIEVFERRTCVNQTPGQLCAGQTGFHVDAEGRVGIGPENGPVETAQTITDEERNAVVNAANAVAEQDLSLINLTCEAWTPESGASADPYGVILKLRDDTQTLRTVYQRSLTTMQLCYRGERALAEALFNSVDSLIDRYGAQPTPSPTPSPSPTASPSPSGSPTPTATPTDAVSILPS